MSRESDALDRYITGNYGEDQFRVFDEGDGICQVSGCEDTAVDGVLCAEHQPPPDRPVKICPTRTPEVHELGEFPMTCYRCHLEADS